MPLVDLPLDQLYTYEGSSPRPLDIDLFWDNALAQMHQVDNQLSLVPAKFKAPGVECFDLWFTGVNGARIYAKYLRPMGKVNCPAILEFHGYTGNSGDWSDKLKYVAAGFCVASMDCRGQGGQSEDIGGVHGNTWQGHIVRGLPDGPDKLLFRDIFLDTAQLANIIINQPEVDASRVGAMGGSQGGALTLACAALEPRIVKASVMYPFLCDYRRVWELDLAKDAYEELRSWFRLFDPMHLQEDQVFKTLSYIDVANLVHRIKGQVIFGTGLMDTVCPPSTQFAAYNRIIAPKEIRIFPDFGHEWLPGFQDESFGFMCELL